MFNIFKKQISEKTIPFSKFKSCYLYGFTNSDNSSTSDKHDVFSRIYNLVFGKTPGLIIPSSYHPYSILNQKGTTVWAAAYVQIIAYAEHETLFDKMIKEKAVFMANAFSFPLLIWPDKRICPEVNKGFQKFVPFVIPFLILDDNPLSYFYSQIKSFIEKEGNANSYLGRINSAIQEFMPAMTFAVGVNEFQDENPSSLIDNFMNLYSAWDLENK